MVGLLKPFISKFPMKIKIKQKIKSTMKASCTIIVLLTLAVLYESATLTGHKNQIAEKRIKQILSRVPNKEKEDFMRYHIQKGYEFLKQKEAEQYPKFHYNIGKDDSILMYKYFATNKIVNDENVVKVARNIICWQDKCIDFSDPGVHP